MLRPTVRNADAADTRGDDAQVALELRTGRDKTCVDQHATAPLVQRLGCPAMESAIENTAVGLLRNGFAETYPTIVSSSSTMPQVAPGNITQ